MAPAGGNYWVLGFTVNRVSGLVYGAVRFPASMSSCPTCELLKYHAAHFGGWELRSETTADFFLNIYRQMSTLFEATSGRIVQRLLTCLWLVETYIPAKIGRSAV